MVTKFDGIYRFEVYGLNFGQIKIETRTKCHIKVGLSIKMATPKLQAEIIHVIGGKKPQLSQNPSRASVPGLQIQICEQKMFFETKFRKIIEGF